MKKIVAIVSLAAIAATAGQAETLLSVGGPTTAALEIEAGEAAGMSFVLERPAENVVVDFPVICLRCEGMIVMNHTAIGPEMDLAYAVGAIALNDTSDQGPFFTFPSLDAGTYFITVGIDSGLAVLPGSGGDYEAVGNGARRGVDFVMEDTAPFHPKSDFDVTFDYGLHFTVTGD